jgi:Glutaminase
MQYQITPSLFEYELAEQLDATNPISMEDAIQLFNHFQQNPLFRWHDSNNGCEGRADAASILLERWNIQHAKAWVFGGAFLKNHIGGLKQNWNYHVAPAVRVGQDDAASWYVIDPSTASQLCLLQEWADMVTDFAHSYHFVKAPVWYIFNEKKITPANWYCRNRQNRKWMIQALAGINSLTAFGKGRLVFNKGLLANTRRRLFFRQLHPIHTGLNSDANTFSIK